MITSAEEFIRLRQSDRPAEYHRAAHEEAPLEIWLDVIARHPEMRFWVAQNKTVPVEVLAILARDGKVEVRLMVAMKNRLPADLMLALADDENQSVRGAIAHHKKAPVEILQRLARDRANTVAEAAKKRLAAAKPNQAR